MFWCLRSATRLAFSLAAISCGQVIGAEIPNRAPAEEHWAFQRPQLPQLPRLTQDSWCRTPIDRFVLAGLRERGLTPSGQADPKTLVRRLSYDLLGLPPSYAQVQALAASSSAARFEAYVDALLAAPQFGERWARHWLDLARFSDTKGYLFQEDRDFPNAYKYRDWVIRSLNDDLPFNQFLMYQIAADELVDDPSDRSHLAALGYLTLGRRFLNNQHDIIDDRIDVVSRGMLGLTVSCARCHNHKYDPISTEDYYALYGVFSSSAEKQDEDLPLRLVDRERPQDAAVLLRGDPSNRGDTVPRRFLSFFDAVHPTPFKEGSGRRELARAIAHPANPLTARVFVNRVWSHLLGEGLVRTPSDFGLRSDPPAHRDVLDYLTIRFVEEDWSVKRLIRRIVLSAVYRQQSALRDECMSVDPENLLLWRVPRRRLDFEAMRDAMLVASGRLDTTIGGPSVRIDTMPPSKRRTLYAHIDRQNLPSLFRTFDFASPDTHVPQRPRTTVPQQALYLMNHPFVQEMAEQTADRVKNSDDDRVRVERLYRLTYARDPTSEEIALGLRFVQQADDANDAPELLGVWARYAQSLLLANEFMVLD